MNNSKKISRSKFEREFFQSPQQKKRKNNTEIHPQTYDDKKIQFASLNFNKYESGIVIRAKGQTSPIIDEIILDKLNNNGIKTTVKVKATKYYFKDDRELKTGAIMCGSYYDLTLFSNSVSFLKNGEVKKGSSCLRNFLKKNILISKSIFFSQNLNAIKLV